MTQITKQHSSSDRISNEQKNTMKICNVFHKSVIGFESPPVRTQCI